MKKNIKPIKTDLRVNRCRCGNDVIQGRFDGMHEGTDKWNGKRAYMGFCKCGRIYLTHYEEVVDF